MSELDKALRVFEAAEANLLKLERLWKEIQDIDGGRIAFGSNPKYENAVRAYEHILTSLPTINGWKPTSTPADIDDIAQSRLDASDIGEPEMLASVERNFEEPGRQLRDYRFRFDLKRRELTRNAINNLIDRFTQSITELQKEYGGLHNNTKLEGKPKWDELCSTIAQIDTLIGSSISRPPRWEDLSRHLKFALVKDLNDIITLDWPEVKTGLTQKLFANDEPIPVDVEDLNDVVSNKPTGIVATALAWDRLSADDFERLIFVLISNEVGYENPEWLMQTSAPDRGRDLSVTRITLDPLTGTRHERIIIQCKHWLSRSISTTDISTLRDQIQLWEPPVIDELIIVTSGRFSADAVTLVEKNNQSNTSLRIKMWPESHLERLLAARPGLIAEFGLR